MADSNSLIPNFESILGTQANQRTAFNANNTAQTNDYLTRYTNFIGGQETQAAMAKRIGDELNLPTLSENAYNINRIVRELPQTYSAATRGFDVNANQLSRIIGQKTSELAPALATANEAKANAQASVDKQMGYAVADQNKALLPYQSEQTLLIDRLARESTGFNIEKENELSTLIAKMNAGITLSEGEKNRAQQLAMQENTFKQEKEMQQMKNKASAIASPYLQDWYNFGLS